MFLSGTLSGVGKCNGPAIGDKVCVFAIVGGNGLSSMQLKLFFLPKSFNSQGKISKNGLQPVNGGLKFQHLPVGFVHVVLKLDLLRAIQIARE